MKYKLIGNNDFVFSPLKTILKNRGIEDIEGFLSLSDDAVNHYSNLINIDEAAECLLKHLRRKARIFIQVDSDVDGVTSSSIIINYIKRVFPEANLEWRMHEGKQHGIILETIPEGVDLVLIPDAGSNQFEEHFVLRQKGIDVIVIDHHECDEESRNAIVVNNQLSPKYKNKALTGAGMAYKLCQALDDKLGKNEAKRFIDLVSVGNIADSADSREPETRYYMNQGLKKVRNPLIKELFVKQAYSTKGKKNIQNTQFYINPLINAAIRIGSQEEKDQMMRSLLESNEEIYYKKRGKNETELVSIHWDTARVLGNIKQRQKKLVDSAVSEIEERIEEKGLLKNKILIVYVEGILNKNLTGLVANQLAGEYKRPVLLARELEDGTLGGSGRGYDKGAVKNFKQLLEETGKFEFVEGHAEAFGFSITPENLIQVNEILNHKLKDIVINQNEYEVDFEIAADNLTERFIKLINSYQDYWGYKVEEPLLAITDIEINKEDISHIGKKTKNTVKFKVGGIEYMKFKSDEEFYESLVNRGDRLVLTVIGKAKVNEYKGKETPQIEIEEMEVVKAKKKVLVF
ncbi:single-stranded-DNA-specific exonuclease RecJ [Bacillus licheniformis]|uniref:Putative SPBc2 prophage-derived single-strand DNA-specific exonuclease YorK n=1 Tax=Bacillus licheniformis TaxID=1402 RepID=A0A8B5YA04_BACLI|nr:MULTISPECIES: single-stranded-DNA-specific exonuclease RecJ [Bacillus subtilis group]ARC58810.1 putative SPBc2 prophage-derived single-strand DNA-specific exonuclease YorK [Bacillus licheniformis]MDE1425525.1 single-stranded-DNA-specific exonuclease RecJ [Bacillus licheniformis]MED4508481.1 single-stranded-DNA-specific exonuclease RecJ [Bacillus licheniformis]NCL92512.1 single-stranded-DNA-specific exonuclease RecJ [Bacillus licheniformis]TWJ43136.1 putative SPBc2 prophage-derived single-st